MRLVPAIGILVASSSSPALPGQVTWTQVGITARTQTAMAYNAQRQRVVVFGGQGAQMRPLGDTLEWDGTRWQRPTPAVAPTPRQNHAMAYDAARGVVVLFGGLDSRGALGDTCSENSGVSGGGWLV